MYPIDRSATIRPFKRPVPVPPTSDKFKARMARQRMLEYEQQMEDLEALKVTPVRTSAFFSFAGLLNVCDTDRRTYSSYRSPSLLSRPSSWTWTVCHGIVLLREICSTNG